MQDHERELLNRLSDRLIELYTERDAAVRDADWSRVMRLGAEISETQTLRQAVADTPGLPSN